LLVSKMSSDWPSTAVQNGQGIRSGAGPVFERYDFLVADYKVGCTHRPASRIDFLFSSRTSRVRVGISAEPAVSVLLCCCVAVFPNSRIFSTGMRWRC
jgi:hypothetical protein